MGSRQVALHAPVRDAQAVGDLRGCEVLPVGEMHDGALANAQRSDGGYDVNIGQSISVRLAVLQVGRQLSPFPPALAPPVVDSCVGDGSIQEGADVVDVCAGTEDTSDGIRYDIFCRARTYLRGREPDQIIGVLLVRLGDLLKSHGA